MIRALFLLAVILGTSLPGYGSNWVDPNYTTESCGVRKGEIVCTLEGGRWGCRCKLPEDKGALATATEWATMDFVKAGLFWGGAALGVIILLSGTLFIVRESEVAIVERLGRFSRVADAGLRLKLPFFERVAARKSMRVEQLDIEIDTKTLDNVFVKVEMSIQNRILPDRVFDAHYKMSDPEEQITAYVEDVVRSQVPKLNLDDVFERKDDVGHAVQRALSDQMSEYGHVIMAALVVDIDPDAHVREAMNNINAAQRNRVAAAEQGEAARILAVKNAEAESQSKELQGKGIALQRKAIVDGLKASVTDFQDAVPGATPADVMALVLTTQYFDTLKEIGAHGKATTILLPHSPGAAHDIAEQVRNAIIVGEETAKS